MDENVVVEVTPKVLGQDTLIDNLTGISPGLKTFLHALIHTGTNPEKTRKSGDNFLVGRKSIQEHLKANKDPCSDSFISKRLRELQDFNAAIIQSHLQTGKKRLRHYQIKDLNILAAIPTLEKQKARKTRTTKSDIRQQKELFKNDDGAILLQDPHNTSIFFHEKVFNGILDSAMRLSHRDVRKEIVAHCRVAGKPLTVTSHCSSAEDSGIAALTDQRAMRSIISFCKKELIRRKAALIGEHGETGFDEKAIPNLFHLDIHDLCLLLGMTCTNQNLNRVVNMMRRLADTSFKVDASENEWFRDNFSMMPGSLGGEAIPKGNIFEFRFLQNFEIAQENVKISDLFGEDITQLRPRFYTFSLEIRMFYTLLLDNMTNLFLSHEELASERSGIIQRFYNWARAFVSSRPKNNLNQQWYSIHDMHQHLTPAARFDNFRNHFMRSLKKFAIDDNWVQGKSGTALVYGYYVYYERKDGENMFRFERDPDDEIVGDNSRHNVLLRQQALEDLSYVG